jgi:penicillin-binding protein 2
MFVLYGVVVAIFCYLASGLFVRQIIQHQKFINLGQRQSHRRILKPAPRGNICDRSGILLAGNRPRFALVAYLQELRGEFAEEYRRRVRQLHASGTAFSPDTERSQARISVLEKHMRSLAPFLSQEISLNRHSIDRHFTQSPLLPYILVFDLPQNDFARLLERLPVDGPLQLETQTARIYPRGTLAAHVIGYAAPSALPQDDGSSNDGFRTFSERSIRGRAGMEEACDVTLRGVNGGEILLVDPSGQRKRVLHAREPVRGRDITLSIDSELQLIAEEALGNEIGCIILSDVRSGEILALANSPTYDPNDLTPRISQENYVALTEKGAWMNQALQGVYPPGSVFKLVSVETLLKYGIVNRHSTHFCDGKTRVGNRIIRCNNHFEHGNLPFAVAVAKSCNSFVIDCIFSLPLQAFLDEIHRFGFDSPTGVELPHETHHFLVPSPQWKKSRGYGSWTDGDTANLAIGQGFLLVTPLQINAFTASLATRRERTQLTIVKAKEAVKPTALGLADDAYEALLEGMKGCIAYGSGRRCQLKNVAVAGKTGTAQIRDGQRNSHLAWFTAFAPAENPEVAVTVMLREPFEGKSYAGGSDAAPIARIILDAYFSRRGN